MLKRVAALQPLLDLTTTVVVRASFKQMKTGGRSQINLPKQEVNRFKRRILELQEFEDIIQYRQDKFQSNTSSIPPGRLGMTSRQVESDSWDEN